MEWNKIIPRLALLALPWQTHLILANDFLVYLSWLPMLLCIVLAFQNYTRPKLNGRGKLVILGFVALLAVSTVSAFPVATFQWWTQIIIVSGFVWSLIRLQISTLDLITWSVISIIPHALLTIQQGITQNVFGSTLLGIAPQDPITRGVAVVESAGVRYLRAYGGLPYPNILGGYLAFALPASLWLAHRHKLWILTSCLFTIALVLTHSRSAWIACAILLVTLAWNYRSTLRVTHYAFPLFFVLCSLLIAIIWQWPLLQTRVTAEGRLEQRSVSERMAGIENGFKTLHEHPWTGIGLNAYSSAFPDRARPHVVPLLITAEVGLVGLFALLAVAYLFLSSSLLKREYLYLIILPLGILALLDHYLWSYWSGHVLFALLTIWTSLGVDKSPKTE